MNREGSTGKIQQGSVLRVASPRIIHFSSFLFSTFYIHFPVEFSLLNLPCLKRRMA